MNQGAAPGVVVRDPDRAPQRGNPLSVSLRGIDDAAGAVREVVRGVRVRAADRGDAQLCDLGFRIEEKDQRRSVQRPVGGEVPVFIAAATDTGLEVGIWCSLEDRGRPEATLPQIGLKELPGQGARNHRAVRADRYRRL